MPIGIAFGLRALPYYDFSAARCIVSFSADFLGTYLAPTFICAAVSLLVEKIHGKQRKMNRLFVLEANMSLTGANADYRTPIRGDESLVYLANLYNILIQKVGKPPLSAPKVGRQDVLQHIAEELWAARGTSLLISGANDYDETNDMLRH